MCDSVKFCAITTSKQDISLVCPKHPIILLHSPNPEIMHTLEGRVKPRSHYDALHPACRMQCIVV